VSIVLHELGHALAATWQGDLTPRFRGHLTWNPVVHMGWISILLALTVGLAWGATPVNRDAFRNRRWGDAIVSFAGPAVHVILAGVAAGAIALLPDFRTQPPDSAERWAVLFWHIVLSRNCALFLLNMIPIPPLDGFHVAEGFVDFGDLGRWLQQRQMMGMVLVMVLISSGVLPFSQAVRWMSQTLGGLPL
jgi:Zn-dependent protease